jgi:lipopolysaccharide assembly outer membrane protein LptD (OstA)
VQNKEQQVSGGVKAKIGEFWSVGSSAGYDIEDSNVIYFGSSLGYQDECFGMDLSAAYTPHYDDENSSGDFTAMVQFRFTNLGNIGSNF